MLPPSSEVGDGWEYLRLVARKLGAADEDFVAAQELFQVDQSVVRTCMRLIPDDVSMQQSMSDTTGPGLGRLVGMVRKTSIYVAGAIPHATPMRMQQLLTIQSSLHRTVSRHRY